MEQFSAIRCGRLVLRRLWLWVRHCQHHHVCLAVRPVAAATLAGSHPVDWPGRGTRSLRVGEGLYPPGRPALDVLAIAFAYVMYAIALFGFHLFDPVALARLTLMEQLSDGMLVLDDQGEWPA